MQAILAGRIILPFFFANLGGVCHVVGFIMLKRMGGGWENRGRKMCVLR